MNSLETHDVEVALDTTKKYVSVRCPECLSAFSVDTSVIANSKPEFECLKCKSIFWFSVSTVGDLDSFIGFPKESNATSHSEEGPDVGPQVALELNNLGTDPFEEDNSRSHLLASDEIKEAWEAAILGFEEQEKHDYFLQLCVAENNLEFAASKYGLLKKSLPANEVVIEMIGKLESLASVRVGVVEKPQSFEVREAGKPAGMFRNIPWYYLIIASSIALILIGMSYPNFRNLVGVGVSIFFLSSAIKILLR